MQRNKLTEYLHHLLNCEAFARGDYAPNGLQVEGKSEIKRIMVAVSASRETIIKAIMLKADALIVHHGLFWNHLGALPVTGTMAGRIAPLIKNDINLYAYHLPLDGHPELGNNAQIAKALKLQKVTAFGGDGKTPPWGVKGVLKKSLKAKQLQNELNKILHHHVTMATPHENAPIRSLGIISGGASSHWREAHAENLDAYITGEMAEFDWYLAQEAGISMFAGGHSASETFGVKALLAHLQKKFPLEGQFIATDNPI